MMIVPYGHEICFRLARWAKKTPGARHSQFVYPLPEDYLPLIAWTPTPDDPEMIEAYLARSYYRRPDSRVSFEDLAIRLATDGVAPEEDEFGWLMPVEEEGRGREKPVYISIGAQVTSAAAALEDPILGPRLRELRAPYVFARTGADAETFDRLGQFIPVQTNGWMGEAGLLRETRVVSRSPVIVEGYDQVIPLRRKDDTFSPALGDFGVLVLYNDLPRPYLAEPGEYQIRIDGNQVNELEPGSIFVTRIIFDPMHEQFYTTEVESLR
jgi:hypothetical protein